MVVLRLQWTLRQAQWPRLRVCAIFKHFPWTVRQDRLALSFFHISAEFTSRLVVGLVD